MFNDGSSSVMPNTNQFYVDQAIGRLVEDFQSFPNKYLTEDDVRVHLCLLLMEHFGSVENTKDRDKSISLHTEIRWWGPEGSQERSDIVLFDVSELSVTKECISRQTKLKLVPRKGYSSNKPIAIIELKLRRNIGESNNQYVKKVNQDLEKLCEINRMFEESYNTSPLLRMVALDKRNPINRLNNHLHGDMLVYCYSTKHIPD